MGIKDLQCIRHSPLFRVFYFDCPWLGQEKKRLSDGWRTLSWDWFLQIQYFIRAPFY